MSKSPKQETSATVSDLLQENRLFKASERFRSQALIKDQSLFEEAKRDRLAFWAKCAEKLDWFHKWDKVLEWQRPFAKWFVGGKLNASYNCLDRHIKAGKGAKTAFYWEGEPGERLTLSYQDVYNQVN